MSSLRYCGTCGFSCDADQWVFFKPLNVIGAFWHKRLPEKYRSDAAYRASFYPNTQSRCRWRRLKNLGMVMAKLYCDPYLKGSVKPGWQERLELDE